MNITSDWHIHSRNSCDAACMLISDLIPEAETRGIRDYGVTDHIHTPYNLPDIAGSYHEFWSNDPSPHFHFGVEASCDGRARHVRWRFWLALNRLVLVLWQYFVGGASSLEVTLANQGDRIIVG